MGDPVPCTTRYVKQRTVLVDELERWGPEGIKLYGTILTHHNPYVEVYGVVYEGDLHFRDARGVLVASLSITPHLSEAGFDYLKLLELILYPDQPESVGQNILAILQANRGPYFNYAVNGYKVQRASPDQNIADVAAGHNLRAYAADLTPWHSHEFDHYDPWKNQRRFQFESSTDLVGILRTWNSEISESADFPTQAEADTYASKHTGVTDVTQRDGRFYVSREFTMKRAHMESLPGCTLPFLKDLFDNLNDDEHDKDLHIVVGKEVSIPELTHFMVVNYLPYE